MNQHLKKSSSLVTKLFFFLAIILFNSSCHKEDIPEPVKEARTLFFYMIADNNLDDDIRKNLVEIYYGMKQYKDPATVLIYWDAGDRDQYWPEPVILRMKTDGNGIVNNITNPNINEEEILNSMEVVSTFPQQISTQPNVFTQVLKQMKSFTPAEDYGLIISSHGSGWLNTITPNGKSIGMDEITDNTLLIPDLRKSLIESGIHFDFLLFDACLMGCAEVCYELRDVVDYCIASPIDVPAPGFPYSEMLCHLLNDTTEYQKACHIFIDKYKATDDMSIHLGTISLIKCSEMEGLAAEINKQLISNPEQATSIDIRNIQQYAGKYSSFKYLTSDIRQYIQELNNGILPASFEEQLNKVVLFKDYVPDSYYFPIEGNNFCGLGMFLPYGSYKDKWVNYFYTLDWSRAAGWDLIKEAY